MTFIQDAIKAAKPKWQKSLDLPFLKEMKAGTLSQETFDHYLYNDIAYLFNYVKLCGKAIYNAETNEDIALFLSLIDISFDLEMNTRFEETEEEGQDLYEGAKAYIDFIMSFAEDETNDRIFLVLLQCMLSYQHVFTTMAEDIENLAQHPYKFFIDDYLSDTYNDHCHAWINYAEKVYQDISEEEADELLAIFLQGSELEYGFWQGAYIRP